MGGESGEEWIHVYIYMAESRCYSCETKDKVKSSFLKKEDMVHIYNGILLDHIKE